MSYLKLDTVAPTTSAQQLDEDSEVVKAAARLAGVSTQAVLGHMRRLQRTQFVEREHASGFVGVSLGHIELPVMNRGVVRKDGWRAATIGEDAIVPRLERGQVAVSVPEEMAASQPSAERSDEEQRDRDVTVLREFMGAMPKGDE